MTPLTALTLSLLAAADLQDDPYRRLQGVDRVTPEVLVVGAVSPSVVFIETEVTQKVDTFFGLRDRTVNGSGSGVVIHADGYIVTNYHVVRSARTITVTFDSNPRRYEAELVSFVRSEDLALLRIHPGPRKNGGFPTARMGTSSDLMRGERVIAIGNPHGQAHTVSTGIISGLHRDVPLPDHGLHFQGLIQTDASINLGNSGGPLLNIRGELIGINTVMNSMAENIGFAIPIDRVREVLTETLFPQAQRRWLGFSLAQGPPLRVESVLPNSPADAAGICEGYTVLALAGTRVQTADEFLHAALELPESGPVAVLVSTPEGEQEIELQAWNRTDGVLFERLGMTVQERRFGRQNWIIVDRVCPGGPASDLGLQKGDLIPALRVSGIQGQLRIRDRSTLAQLIERLKPGSALDLNIYRDIDGNKEFEQDELYEGVLQVR